MISNGDFIGLYHYFTAKYDFFLLRVRFNVGLYSQEYYIITGFTTANGSHVFKGLCYLPRARCAYLILLTKRGPELFVKFRVSSFKVYVL